MIMLFPPHSSDDPDSDLVAPRSVRGSRCGDRSGMATYQDYPNGLVNASAKWTLLNAFQTEGVWRRGVRSNFNVVDSRGGRELKGFFGREKIRHVRDALGSEPCANPLGKRNAWNKANDVFDIPKVSVLCDPTLFVEAEPGDDMKLEMEWRRQGECSSRDLKRGRCGMWKVRRRRRIRG